MHFWNAVLRAVPSVTPGSAGSRPRATWPDGVAQVTSSTARRARELAKGRGPGRAARAGPRCNIRPRPGPPRPRPALGGLGGKPRFRGSCTLHAAFGSRLGLGWALLLPVALSARPAAVSRQGGGAAACAGAVCPALVKATLTRKKQKEKKL